MTERGAGDEDWPTAVAVAPRRQRQRSLAVVIVVLVIAVPATLVGRATLNDDERSESAPHFPATAARPYSGEPTRVSVYEYAFEPATLVVKPGTVVAWKADGDEPHIVTPRGEPSKRIFFSANDRGQSRHVFREKGVYPYYCSIHEWMRGKVVVR